MPLQELQCALVEAGDVLVDRGVGAVFENKQLGVTNVLLHRGGEAG